MSERIKKKLDEINIERRKPTVINFLYKLILYLGELSPYTHIKRFFDPKDVSFRVEEGYNIVFVLVLLVLVFVGPRIYGVCTVLLPIILLVPICRIFDLLRAHLDFILLHSERGTRTDDGYIIIRHAQRWIVFLFADFLQIVLSFAVIYWVIDILKYGCEAPFHKPFYVTGIPIDILESLRIGINAFYFSLVTIVTLGYGDFRPTTPLCRLLVSSEILIGLFFLFLVFVIAMPTIKTKIDVNMKYKNKISASKETEKK